MPLHAFTCYTHLDTDRKGPKWSNLSCRVHSGGIHIAVPLLVIDGTLREEKFQAGEPTQGGGGCKQEEDGHFVGVYTGLPEDCACTYVGVHRAS